MRGFENRVTPWHTDRITEVIASNAPPAVSVTVDRRPGRGAFNARRG